MSIYNFQIDLQCPQCGAPVVLDETECILQCRFCRTRHILHTLPYPCYYMEPGQEPDAGRRLVYVPYWRFKGLEFSLGGRQPGFRVVDHSYLAVERMGLPVSLGLRPQTQTLKFIRNGLLGSFLAPDICQKEILKQIAGGKDQKIFIGEILSLIFMPFYQDKDSVHDGLSGNTFAVSSSDLPAEKKSPALHIEFTPCLCPDCGWDLKGETDSLVLFCSNCPAFWLIRNNRLNPLETRVFDTRPDTDLLLPFWRFQVEFQTFACSSYAHLMKIANIPKPVLKDHEKQPVYFYVPAFKLNPKLFLRIGRQITLAQIEPSQAAKRIKIRRHPANLPPEEGFQAVLPLLMALCSDKKETWQVLENEKLKLNAFTLTYVPFRTSGSEYIQDTLGVSLPMNSLRFGRQL